MKKIVYCKNCMNMSTRPRIEFDYRGWCNACQWMEEKKTMEWASREKELLELLEKNKNKRATFDCIVPVSGGKDGSYVSYCLKHKYKMRPLTITIRPPLELDLGKKNLLNFTQSGYDHIHVTPDSEVMRRMNKMGFIEKGFPYYGWLTAIMTAVIRIAINFKIPLIFYGEDGEVEYGGSTESKYNPIYDIHYMKKIYLEGGHDKFLHQCGTDEELYFFNFPSDAEINGADLSFTHWSYYEAWDSYRNYLVAKEFCGLVEQDSPNAGTFTNFAQNDQALYALHAYIMYLKFGFGRATQDAGIEIRRGAMTRDQAVELIKLYDNQYPEEFIPEYLSYYQMSMEEFDSVLGKWANRTLFRIENGRWMPVFTPGEDFEC